LQSDNFSLFCAQNLYKKFDFKKVAKIPKQLQYKGRLLDEIIMIKEL